MADEKKNDIKFDEEEMKQIQEDITKAKGSLVSKEAEEKIKQAKEDAKKEAEKEFVTNQKIKELEEQNKKLAEEKLAKEQEFAEKFEGMNRKINELIGSKQPVKAENPFKQNESRGAEQFGKDVTHLSDDAVNAIEEKSAELFLGEDYSKPI